MRIPIVHNDVSVVFDLEENIQVATTYWVATMIGLNTIMYVVFWKRAYATDPTGVVIHGSELNKSAFPMIQRFRFFFDILLWRLFLLLIVFFCLLFALVVDTSLRFVAVVVFRFVRLVSFRCCRCVSFRFVVSILCVDEQQPKQQHNKNRRCFITKAFGS